jgi:hypothetical protein
MNAVTIEELEAYIPVVTGTQYADVIQGNGTSILLKSFTSLGDGSPKIKMKKLTGTTASTQGGEVNITHGLTRTKILSCIVLVQGASSVTVEANYTRSGTYQFGWYIDDTGINIGNITANSSSILSKPITVLITYEE